MPSLSALWAQSGKLCDYVDKLLPGQGKAVYDRYSEHTLDAFEVVNAPGGVSVPPGLPVGTQPPLSTVSEDSSYDPMLPDLKPPAREPPLSLKGEPAE